MLKNITFSADENLIQQARRQATLENTTLNELFREWLTRYVAQPLETNDYDALMERLAYVQAKAPYSREEMNER